MEVCATIRPYPLMGFGPNAVRHANFLRILGLRSNRLLATRLPPSKYLPAVGKLVLLWVVGLAIFAVDDRIDYGRLFNRACNCSRI